MTDDEASHITAVDLPFFCGAPLLLAIPLYALFTTPKPSRLHAMQGYTLPLLPARSPSPATAAVSIAKRLSAVMVLVRCFLA